MKKIETKLEGVYIIEPDVHGDYRGWFMETWTAKSFEDLGLHYNFVQDNQSFSAKKGTLRGLHFQNAPMSQAKLVRCLKGEIMDVAVDMRKGSPTYKQWTNVILSAENKKMFLIPRGFAHGFVTLTDDVEFAYKCDNYYDKPTERGICFNDATIGVEWGIDNPILSQKDIDAPTFENSDCNFVYGQI